MAGFLVLVVHLKKDDRDEDRSQVCTAQVPQVLAAFRNAAISLLPLMRTHNIAAHCRLVAARPKLAFATLGPSGLKSWESDLVLRIKDREPKEIWMDHGKRKSKARKRGCRHRSKGLTIGNESQRCPGGEKTGDCCTEDQIGG